MWLECQNFDATSSSDVNEVLDEDRMTFACSRRTFYGDSYVAPCVPVSRCSHGSGLSPDALSVVRAHPTQTRVCCRERNTTALTFEPSPPGRSVACCSCSLVRVRLRHQVAIWLNNSRRTLGRHTRDSLDASRTYVRPASLAEHPRAVTNRSFGYRYSGATTASRVPLLSNTANDTQHLATVKHLTQAALPPAGSTGTNGQAATNNRPRGSVVRARQLTTQTRQPQPVSAASSRRT